MGVRLHVGLPAAASVWLPHAEPTLMAQCMPSDDRSRVVGPTRTDLAAVARRAWAHAINAILRGGRWKMRAEEQTSMMGQRR